MSELLVICLVIVFLPVISLVFITGFDVTRQIVHSILKAVVMTLNVITKLVR